MNIGIENEKTEFKKSTSELREGLTSLASMLNKNGYGILYFGIKDNGDIIGQQIGDRTLREVSQAIANFIKPQIIPTINLKLIDNKNVIKIEVSGYEKPYSAYGRYYMRSSDEDRELTPLALKELMDKQYSADSLSILESVNQDLTFKKLTMAFVSAGLNIDQQTFEKNAGLLCNNGKYNMMAYLLADENDISIKVVTFAGIDKSVIIRRNEYGGTCLISSIDKVLDYMESLNETKVSIGTHRRAEEKLFDYPSFKEAWQNACLHTKWDKGNPPTVNIFSDRIEIISTGGLPYDLNKEEFYKGISKPVNIKLQKIFGQLGYVEQTGHGVPLIINNYGKQAFDIMENFINVIIPFNFEKSSLSPTQNSDNTALSKIEETILGIIMQNSHIKIHEIAEFENISESYTRKILSSLKGKNIITRCGGRKEGYWKINE